MNIKVIGSGCENCDKTNAIIAECVEELGIDAKIERVADLVEIVKLGVMTAPSVMIDGKLVISGQVPSKKQNMYLLKVPVLEILPMQRRFWKLQKYWLGKYMISVAVFVWWTATIFWISWRTKLPSTVS